MNKKKYVVTIARQFGSMGRPIDEAREAYHLQYAGFKPDDYNHKDLMINSSLLGVDGTAEYLATLIKKKFCL